MSGSKKPSYWRDENRVRRAIDLRNQGVLPAEIREILVREFKEEVTVANVSAKLCRLGITRRDHAKVPDVDEDDERDFVDSIPGVPPLKYEDDLLPPPPVAKDRKCLVCRNKFFSPHAGIRKCPPCKARFQAAESLGDYAVADFTSLR
jgi:hypothetical protein